MAEKKQLGLEEQVEKQKELSRNPREHGVPHDAYRNAQWDAINAALELARSGGGHIFAEAPTGTGKSAIAATIGDMEQTTVLVGTLNLVDQYANQYGFQALKGRKNYLCVLEKKRQEWNDKYKRLPTAADCHFNPMHKCSVADSCPYLMAKERALSAKRAVLTYPYAMLSHKVRERTGVLICDEAHEIVEQLIGFGDFEMGDGIRKKWDLPKFPMYEYGEGNKGDVLNTEAYNKVVDWLRHCVASLGRLMADLDDFSSEFAQAKRLAEKLERVISTLKATFYDDWFLEVGVSLVREKRGNGWQNVPGIRLRSLTAQHVADRLWSHKYTTLLMSATIGDPQPLANELGIKHYGWRSYPHPVPVQYRPVYDLGVQRMTHSNIKANPNLFKIQAVQIANWIKTECDPAWRGIILTSSYKKINELYTYLRPMLVGRDLIVQKAGFSLDKITQHFIQPPQRPGQVLIASIQGFGHGLDLRGDLARFAVVAGVPHSNPMDRYEQVRKSRPGGGKYAWWSAYATIPQATGRVSRSEPGRDGEPWLLNKAALADGSTTAPLALKNYPAWFNEAIV